MRQKRRFLRQHQLTSNNKDVDICVKDSPFTHTHTQPWTSPLAELLSVAIYSCHFLSQAQLSFELRIVNRTFYSRCHCSPVLTRNTTMNNVNQTAAAVFTLKRTRSSVPGFRRRKRMRRTVTNV